MKEEPGKAVVSPQAVIDSAFAVGAVSDHLMTEACEVPADLMSPSLARGNREEPIALLENVQAVQPSLSFLLRSHIVLGLEIF